MGLSFMYLVLFDIDGTLLRTGQMGQTSAREALIKVFGTPGRIDHFYPGGRTIEGIFFDTLSESDFNEKDYIERRDELYAEFFLLFQNKLDHGQHRIYPLPGALTVLGELSNNNEILLGLVTGNHHKTAELKLQAAGITPDLFKVGAFGHESADRNDLVPLARKRAEELTGMDYSGQSTIVIGDTTRDVISAKSAGARSIALTTGTDNQELLETVKPDFIFQDLCDLDEVLNAITGEL